MAHLERHIGRHRQPSSSGQAESTGLTFDKLPYDVKHAIFEMAQSLPSWVHFKFSHGHLVEVNEVHQEIYVNREWYQAPELRQGLSRHREPRYRLRDVAKELFELLFRDRNIVRALQVPRNLGDKPFYVHLKRRVKTPSVKRRIDWFFFDGTVTAQAGITHAHQIRTCVFRLDALYDYMQHYYRKATPPKFIWNEASHVEELVILVGEFRKEVQPSEMREIAAFWIDDFPEHQRHIARVTIQKPDDMPSHVFSHQEYMMEQYSNHLLYDIYKHRRERFAWLASELGKGWLTHKVHDKHNIISRWLASSEGQMWLWSHGAAFLASRSGWWWLASAHGYPTLETEKGIHWLSSLAAWEFLRSEQALLWANTGTYRSHIAALGTQVDKAWFRTRAGGEWKYAHCPDGRPPTPPRRPRGHGLDPARQIPKCFYLDFRFRGWRFVMCPGAFAPQQPQAQVDHVAVKLPLSAINRLCTR
ncbi:hypothetical protein F4819DRAFT_499923 [Hypoxylon fuscum]|nr:hypothetical protein F4819DRAFT_499923 [Hypoxylon fuscum]